MRFGISATSLMCPKNLRTRLRPVNVCCAIVASRYRRPPSGKANPPKRDLGVAPGLNFHPIPRSKEANYGGFRPEFVLQTFKTQNNARGNRGYTRSSDPSHHGLQKPEICLISQRLMGETPPAPQPQTALFVLPPRYGMAIMEIRETSPRIPTLFCVR